MISEAAGGSGKFPLPPASDATFPVSVKVGAEQREYGERYSVRYNLPRTIWGLGGEG